MGAITNATVPPVAGTGGTENIPGTCSKLQGRIVHGVFFMSHAYFIIQTVRYVIEGSLYTAGGFFVANPILAGAHYCYRKYGDPAAIANAFATAIASTHKEKEDLKAERDHLLEITESFHKERETLQKSNEDLVSALNVVHKDLGEGKGSKENRELIDAIGNRLEILEAGIPKETSSGWLSSFSFW